MTKASRGIWIIGIGREAHGGPVRCRFHFGSNFFGTLVSPTRGGLR